MRQGDISTSLDQHRCVDTRDQSKNDHIGPEQPKSTNLPSLTDERLDLDENQGK